MQCPRIVAGKQINQADEAGYPSRRGIEYWPTGNVLLWPALPDQAWFRGSEHQEFRMVSFMTGINGAAMLNVLIPHCSSL